MGLFGLLFLIVVCDTLSLSEKKNKKTPQTQTAQHKSKLNYRREDGKKIETLVQERISEQPVCHS